MTYLLYTSSNGDKGGSPVYRTCEGRRCGRTILFLSLQREVLRPTVSSGAAIRLSATVATVNNRSKPVLSRGVGGAEPAGGAVGVGGTEGVGVAGGASLSATRLSGLGGGAGAVATGADGAIGGATAAAVRIGGSGAAVRVVSGAEVRIGTATAAVGMGALRMTSGLEWYPNQNTVAGAGVAGGKFRGCRRSAE